MSPLPGELKLDHPARLVRCWLKKSLSDKHAKLRGERVAESADALEGGSGLRPSDHSDIAYSGSISVDEGIPTLHFVHRFSSDIRAPSGRGGSLEEGESERGGIASNHVTDDCDQNLHCDQSSDRGHGPQMAAFTPVMGDGGISPVEATLWLSNSFEGTIEFLELIGVMEPSFFQSLIEWAIDYPFTATIIGFIVTGWVVGTVLVFVQNFVRAVQYIRGWRTKPKPEVQIDLRDLDAAYFSLKARLGYPPSMPLRGVDRVNQRREEIERITRMLQAEYDNLGIWGRIKYWWRKSSDPLI